MWLNELCKRWVGRTSRKVRRQRRHLRTLTRTQLRLEELEDRTLLTGPVSLTVGAADTQTLINDINLANNNSSSSSPYTIDLTNSTYSGQGFSSFNANGVNMLPVITAANLTINGNGATLDGDSDRIFDVSNGSSLTLENMTLTGGRAIGAGTAAEGGAIYSSGTLKLSASDLDQNGAEGNTGATGAGGKDPSAGGAGGNAAGGGLYIAGGRVTLTNDTLSANFALGGTGGKGGKPNPTFFYNHFTGGTGGTGGNGSGGGLYVAGGNVTVSSDTFTGNEASGGSGGEGGDGNSFFGGGGIRGDGGNGGDGTGGGLYVVVGASVAGFSSNSISSNSSSYGQGGAGGNNNVGKNGANGSASYSDIAANNSGYGYYSVFNLNPTSGLQLVEDISFADDIPGTYTITLTNSSIYVLDNSSGALPVIDADVNITIVGNGTTIERSSSASAFRLFDVANDASLTLQDLTLSGGLTEGSGTAAEGGAIYSSGTLTLSNVVMQNNTAQGGNGANGKSAPGFNGTSGGSGSVGGGAYGGGLYVAAGNVTLTNDTLSGNIAQGGNGGTGGVGAVGAKGGALKNAGNGGVGGMGGIGGVGWGGGMYVAAGRVTLNNDSLSDNLAQGGAGGQAGTGGTGGAGPGNLVTRSGNGGKGGLGGTGGDGVAGGLAVGGGQVVLTGSTFSGNKAQGGAGGTGGDAAKDGISGRLVGSTHDGTAGSGGIGGDGMGGGVYVYGATFTLSDDTLSGNQAKGGSGGTGAKGLVRLDGGQGGSGGLGNGGGLYVGDGASLTNVTLSGNQAQGGNGGAGGAGGAGILGKAGNNGSGGGGNGGAGGGLFMFTSSRTTLANTLIAENTVAGGSAGGSAAAAGNGFDPDVDGTASSSDHDLIGDGTGSNLSNGTNGDLVGTSASPINPLLGSLQNNSGSTQTEAILPGSPAIDAGDKDASNLPSTDQRGYARIVNDAVDIGAYQYQYDLSITGSAPSVIVASVDQPITYSIAVQNNGPDLADQGVTLTDVLPSGLTLQSISTPSGWTSSYQNGTVTATTSQLASGASATFSLTALVGGVADTLANTITIGPSTWDNNISNNSVTLDSVAFSLTDISSPDKLASAIDYANSTGTPITITLVSGTTFNFVSANNTTNGANALPVITGDITIVGNGDTIERTGSNVLRFFDVSSTGSLTLESLTLSGGLAQGTGAAAEGGAIYSSGTLSLSGVTVQNNMAVGSAGADGQRTAERSGVAGGSGSNGTGGGLFVAGGVASLSNDILNGNQAQGGNGGKGHQAVEGYGGAGGNGGNGSGGGLTLAGGLVTLTGVTLSDNRTQGGTGGVGGNGGSLANGNGGGMGGAGGDSIGGGICVEGGSVVMLKDNLSGNKAQGGTGGMGGNDTLGGSGATGGAGGSGTGAGVFVSGGSVSLSSDTFGSNQAQGGNGGNGGNGAFFGGAGGNGGDGTGGGLYVNAGITVGYSSTTISNNTVAAGEGGSRGTGSLNHSDGSAGTTSFSDLAANSSGFGVYQEESSQTMTFNSLPNKIYGNNDFALSATASSGLAVSYTTSGAATVYQDTSGNWFVHITGTGVAIITASQAGNSSYLAAPNVSQTLSIAKATPTVPTPVVSSENDYDGQPKAATVGDVIGVNNEDLGQPTLTYYSGIYTLATLPISGGSITAPTDAGDYTVVASYAGNSNYNSASAIATYGIDQVTPTVPTPVVSSENDYDGQPKAATVGDVIGVNNEDLGQPTLTYYSGIYTLATLPNSGGSITAPTDAGDYTVVASYAGNSNYNSASAIATYGIDQVTPTVPTPVVSSENEYDGQSKAATVGDVIGVNNENLGQPTLTYYSGTYTLATLPSAGGSSTPPTGAGNYTVVASYAGSTNYTSARSLATYGIDQVSPTVSVTDAGGPYNGKPYPATATAVGVDGATPVSGSFTFVYYAGAGTSGISLGSTAPTSPGNYTVLAIFTSADANYTYGIAQTTLTISAATTPSPSPAPSPRAPSSLNAPPLLALIDSLLGAVATVNADGTETITDSIFGIPLLVAKFDGTGNVTSISLFGIDVTFWFTLLG